MELNIRGASSLQNVSRVYRNVEGELDVTLQHGEQLTANGIIFRSQDDELTVELSSESWIILEPKGGFTFGGEFPPCELMGEIGEEGARMDFPYNGWAVIVLLKEGKAFISFN